MLAAAVGPSLTKLLHDQLDLMFAYGLSEPLRVALVAIGKFIPPLLRTLQGKQLIKTEVLLYILKNVIRETSGRHLAYSQWAELSAIGCTDWHHFSSSSYQQGLQYKSGECSTTII
jgi:hypothetical protein